MSLLEVRDVEVVYRRRGRDPLRAVAGASLALERGDPQKLLTHVLNSHTPVEEAGRIAQEAGVKTLVLAHTVSLMPGVTDGMWIAAARKHFSGEVIFAHDLMVL